MQETEKSFFMVYVEGGSMPSKRHEDQFKAQEEAERLCNKMGKSAYILKAISKASLRNVEYSELE